MAQIVMYMVSSGTKRYLLVNARVLQIGNCDFPLLVSVNVVLRKVDFLRLLVAVTKSAHSMRVHLVQHALNSVKT